jgi:hypothetical protein
MVLLAITGVLGGLFMVQALEGYTLSRSSAEKTQKAQAALVRIGLELENLTGISSYSHGGSSLAYTTRLNSREPDVLRTISLVNGQVRIIDGTTLPTAGTGSILMDGVSVFQLRYYQASESGTLSSWTGSLKDLYVIEVQIALTGTGPLGSPAAFTTTITPRRSGHWDGPADWNL